MNAVPDTVSQDLPPDFGFTGCTFLRNLPFLEIIINPSPHPPPPLQVRRDPGEHHPVRAEHRHRAHRGPGGSLRGGRRHTALPAHVRPAGGLPRHAQNLLLRRLPQVSPAARHGTTAKAGGGVVFFDWEAPRNLTKIDYYYQ